MHTRLSFTEPIGHSDDIAFATSQLIADLCVRLEAAHLGARHLELALYRTDATVVRATVGTSHAVRDPAHLERLFREKLQKLDAGFGVEVITLAAVTVAPLASIQPSMGFGQDLKKESTAKLVDCFCNRLGNANVVHLTEHASHIPELACREVPARTGEHAPRTGPAPITNDSERSQQPRPLKLLPSPEPIEVIAPVPDGPPVAFRWHRIQHRVIAAEGPERIGPEWWLDGTYGYDPEHLSRIRDYYRVENLEGHRFWIYREGLYRSDINPRWYLHGFFP
jgi:protein ImuB